MNNEFAFVVKTFERPQACAKLISSIRRHYPGVTIYLADDSKKPYAGRFEGPDVEVLPLPFDSGLSAGRNKLFRTAVEPFLFLCDDDFVMKGTENPGRLVAWAEEFGLDVVGVTIGQGRYRQADSFDTRFFKESPNQIRIVRGQGIQLDAGLMTAEFVANAGIFRRESVLSFGAWDEDFKLHEHGDFFWRAKKAGIKVAETSKHWTGHEPCTNGTYRKHRRRSFTHLYQKKYGKTMTYAADRGSRK